jgi:hypothetical protein
MQLLPPRTRTTTLTDDQLLLFDFMFDSWVPFRALRRKLYSLSLNVAYSHSLDDHQLAATLKELQSNSFVRMRESEDVREGAIIPFYTLTEIGGQLWEAERQPIWDAYCTEWGEEDGVVSVWALVLATAEAFLETAEQCLLYDCDLNQRTAIVHQPAEYNPGVSLIPWKVFPQAYELRAPLRTEKHWPDWLLYEQQRTWWHNVTDLVTLRRSGIV